MLYSPSEMQTCKDVDNKLSSYEEGVQSEGTDTWILNATPWSCDLSL